MKDFPAASILTRYVIVGRISGVAACGLLLNSYRLTRRTSGRVAPLLVVCRIAKGA